MENIGTLILATGALGTAAFGIVEALKWTWIGNAGFGAMLRLLGGPILEALKNAYGEGHRRVLRSQYKGDQHELARMLRQGVRVGLTAQNAASLGGFVGVVNATELTQAAEQAAKGDELSPELRNVLGKFELAVDARIDAALALAQNRYEGAVRIAASVVALAIALVTGNYLAPLGVQQSRLLSVLVGVAAVPLAPVAKDLVTALQAASDALRRRL